MIKLETHCHSMGGSYCADTPAEVIAQKYHEAGYGGIVLTNHYALGPFNDYPVEGKKEKIDYFFSLIEHMRSCCAKYGIKVFYGAEVNVVNPKGYSEFMLYGFKESFLYDNKYLYEYTQEELFRLADKNGVFMYQTHPFRKGVVAGNPRFMHGAEYFNGHFHHVNNNDIASRFCEENKLVKMSGTDYHHIDQPITAGTYIPESVNDNTALVNYILSGKAQRIEERKLYLKRLAEYRGEI